jgi:hypothetical protein
MSEREHRGHPYFIPERGSKMAGMRHIAEALRAPERTDTIDTEMERARAQREARLASAHLVPPGQTVATQRTGAVPVVDVDAAIRARDERHASAWKTVRR